MAISNLRKHLKTIVLLGIVVFTILTVTVLQISRNNKPPKTVITTDTVKDVGVGRIVKGVNNSEQPKVLSTEKELQYESKELKVENHKTTAAVLKWSQAGKSEGVEVELRTFDGNNWSQWIASESGDSPDDKPIEHSAIIISKDIQRVQYRFNLEGSKETPSPAVDLSEASVETIDTSKGPSLDEKPLWQRIISSIKLDNTASARNGQPTPQIYNRADWGSPEPGGSPNWIPEYRPLTRAIVHHTATTASADSAAAIRAIWQYHTQSKDWGDIGYNYLVDQQGRIFQGRYFDAGYADKNNVDVVAGHAYGNNYGTTGIAVLGDFTNSDPSGAALNSIARMAAYKLGAYNINPGDGTNLIGHRDVVATACPGARLYPQLGALRSIASSLFPAYQVRPFTWQYDTQYAYTDETKTTPVNLMNATRGQRVFVGIRAKNVGTEVWHNTGLNAVKVGTSNPQDRNSKFCDPSWLGCNRPAVLKEPEVEVGNVGTFEFWYNVPVSGGNFNEYFNLLAEGAMWMNDPGLYFGTYAPPPIYTWQFTDQFAYTDNSKTNSVNLANLVPGQRVYVGYQAKNTGNVAWTNTGGNAVKSGASNPRGRSSPFCDASWPDCTRSALLKESSVAPGAIGTFEFWYKAPSNYGEYREYYTPVAEGIAWMNDLGLNFYTRVISASLSTPDTDRLIINQQLNTNQSIISKDGRYRLVTQSDGNLVLYSPNRYLWASNTMGKASARAIMQGDGNIVLYDSQNNAYWSSGTAGRGQSFLVLQNDGNLVAYDYFNRPIWYTGTNGRL